MSNGEKNTSTLNQVKLILRFFLHGTTEEFLFFSLLHSFWALKHSTYFALHCVTSWKRSNILVFIQRYSYGHVNLTVIIIYQHINTSNRYFVSSKLYNVVCQLYSTKVEKTTKQTKRYNQKGINDSICLMTWQKIPVIRLLRNKNILIPQRTLFVFH